MAAGVITWAAVSLYNSFQAQRSNTIAVAESKVQTRVKNARRNIYKFFEIWFDRIGAPILGRSLSRAQAISSVRQGLNVITYFESDARNVANSAG